MIAKDSERVRKQVGKAVASFSALRRARGEAYSKECGKLAQTLGKLLELRKKANRKIKRKEYHKLQLAIEQFFLDTVVVCIPSASLDDIEDIEAEVGWDEICNIVSLAQGSLYAASAGWTTFYLIDLIRQMGKHALDAEKELVRSEFVPRLWEEPEPPKKPREVKGKHVTVRVYQGGKK